jgi:ubiquinol-cytochrome c reductase iron-sulfur subunit
MSTPDLPRREPAAEASDRTDAWRRQRERQDRAARHAAVAFAVATLAALALVAVYITGGQTQIEGLLLAIAFGGIGTGIGIWVKRIVGPQEIVEERYPMRSDDGPPRRLRGGLRRGDGRGGAGGTPALPAAAADRRRGVARARAAAAAALARSGPAQRAVLHLLGAGQAPASRPRGGRCAPATSSPDQVVTVFPEGAVGSADSQAVLVGLRDGAFDRGSFAAETVDGMVVYSKICTHAGCPVGLYRARAGELLCPCHQSTFDVNRGAVVCPAPPGAHCPSCPIGTDDEGYLVALGDFTEPVGPSFWNLTETPEA